MLAALFHNPKRVLRSRMGLQQGLLLLLLLLVPLPLMLLPLLLMYQCQDANIFTLQARQVWEALLYAQPGVRESDAGAAAFETLVSSFQHLFERVAGLL